MYYINAKPNSTGNYGNPMGQPFEGYITLPDDLLSDYIEASGFIIPTIEDGSVTALEVNQEALDAYLVEHPDVQPEEPVSETEQLRADIDYIAVMTGIEL